MLPILNPQVQNSKTFKLLLSDVKIYSEMFKNY